MKIKKKILKNFIIQSIIATLVAFYIYLVRLTSTITIHNSHIPSKYWDSDKPFILVFWHSQLMMISFSWKIKKKINILASGHSDGRFGAIVGKYFKLDNIQTSNLNSNLSLRKIFKVLKSNNYLGITPDGPRGPKQKASEGVIKIAKHTNIAIIPIGFWSSKNFKLNSWDSFLITLPFSKCNFVWGNEIMIPSDSNDKEIENFQNILEKRINECVVSAKNNLK